MSARTDGAGSFAQRSMWLVKALDGREVHHSDCLFLSKAHEGVSERWGFVRYIYIYKKFVCVCGQRPRFKWNLLAGKPK